MGDIPGIDPRAEHAIDAINEVVGRHEARRAVHAKGVVVRGMFTATPDAGRLCRAAHLQGAPVPVVGRFSNASGNPEQDDAVRDGRGLAVKFLLPDGSRTDIVAVNLPSFLARTPEDFIAFTRAAKPLGNTDIPSPKLLWFLATHREAWPAARAGATMKPIPSYANCRYNALHAFWWTGADGERRAVRYSWKPEAGEAILSRSEAKHRGPDYLQEEMVEHLGREPVRFALAVQIAGEGDPTDDPTHAWPAQRETVTAGTLELTAIDTTRERDGDVLVFDPTRVTDGIELSDDPILRFRTDAYAVSVFRRTGVARASSAS